MAHRICGRGACYCALADALLNAEDLHLTAVAVDPKSGYRLGIETAAGPRGCPSCGVIAAAHGRRLVTVNDAPVLGLPVVLRWRKRVFRCLEWVNGQQSLLRLSEKLFSHPRLTLGPLELSSEGVDRAKPEQSAPVSATDQLLAQVAGLIGDRRAASGTRTAVASVRGSQGPTSQVDPRAAPAARMPTDWCRVAAAVAIQEHVSSAA